MSDKDGKKGGGGKDRGDRGGDEPKDRRPPPERSGHVAPADPVFVEFLERLWTRENPPTRLEVWWMLGANKDVRRDLVFYENFRQPEKPEDNWHIEHCARLAGEILRAVQDWTDGKRRPCSFQVAILDSYQQTKPLSKTIGPFHPEQAYAGVAPDGEPQSYDDEEEDGLIGMKPITHKYLSKMVRSMHRTMEQVHSVMGDFMQIQQNALQARDAANERLHMINAQLHESKQTAEDRAAERTVWVRKEEAKVKAIEGSLKVGTTLLYGWLGMPMEASGESAGAQGGDAQAARRHPPSAEQQQVAIFLQEAKEEKLSVALFGDWKNTDSLTVQDVLAGIGQEKPGIFTPQQFGILLAVYQGLLPPDALDVLLTDSGMPQAITAEQTLRAQPLVTQPMAAALMMIRQLRLAAREKRQGLPQAAPQGDPT